MLCVRCFILFRMYPFHEVLSSDGRVVLLEAKIGEKLYHWHCSSVSVYPSGHCITVVFFLSMSALCIQVPSQEERGPTYFNDMIIFSKCGDKAKHQT